MPAYAALLRAVNLGPHNQIAMGDLKALALSLGFTQPQTLLQSGNLVFQSSARSSPGLETLLEQALVKKHRLQTPVVVRSAAEWRKLVTENPFAAEAKRDPGHLLLMPLKGKPTAARVAELASAIVGRESVKAGDRALYLAYPDGIGRSKLTLALIEKKIGLSGTARNWNTVQKLLALLEA